MIHFQAHILVIIMCNENILNLCVTSDHVPSENDSVLSGRAVAPEKNFSVESSFEKTTVKTKKTRGTYKKQDTRGTYRKRTTTRKSIRNEETSSANIDKSPFRQKQVATKPNDADSTLETMVVETTTERPIPSSDSTTPLSEDTLSCTTTRTIILNTFLYRSANKTSKKAHSLKHDDTTKRPLDRRRQVIMGGRPAEHHHQDLQKRFTVKHTPIMHHRKTFLFKNFTPKYSPIKYQSLFQQVIDLRKMRTSPSKARPDVNNITRRTTPNKYEEELEEVLAEYEDILSEERKFNESRKEFLKKELEEIKIRQASMQKSYLFQFIVTKVTTESWEKDLPKSSRGKDEEYLDPYEARLDNEPVIRRTFFIRKGRAKKKIEIARQKLNDYRNGTLTKYTTRGIKQKSFHSYDDDEDRSELPREHSEDRGVARHIVNLHTKGLNTKANAHTKKSSQNFQPNEHYRQMQKGWAQRDLMGGRENVDKRKEDALDIYEPEPQSSDEMERMKSYDITSNQQFIEYLKDNKFAQDPRVLAAIHWVDRDRFAKDGYVDSPHNFGTNSIVERPSYQALCLDHLADKLVPGANVLDLGFGSGFMSCCMARMVGDTGHVTAVEHIQHLVNLLLTKLKISYPKFYKLYKMMDIVDWDGRKPYKKNGPYDVIHFGGGVNYVPLEFVHDLKINGSILVPVGPPYGPHILKKITLIKKNVYTIQNLAEVETLHFCGSDEQVHEFRQIYGHHFIKLFSLFYKPARPFSSTVVGRHQTYKLPDN